MAAPTYTWEFVQDLLGDSVPKIITMEASSALETKVGTLLIADSAGQADEATTDALKIVGLAVEATTAAATAGDPVKVAVLAPGMVIKGTSDADASSRSGFYGKLFDVNTDGSLDYADDANGSLSIYRTEDSGLTVYCVVASGALY
jgi:hypothetical protein